MSIRLSSSIALASCNGERHMREQLASIACQTMLPDELVVYDDASTDATPAIVLDFARHAPFPVRYFQNSKRVGTVPNFENAIRACEGEIIFLCDQDDVWHVNKIALIKERFISSPDVGAVFTDANIVDENLHSLGYRLWQVFKFTVREQAQVAFRDALGVLIKHPVVTGATMAFRSHYRDLVLPLTDTWHDAWISFLIGATSHLDAVPSPLVTYRLHNGNQLGIPRRGRNRGKSCEVVYGPMVRRYEMVLQRLQERAGTFPCSTINLGRIEEALSFLRVRAALPDARWRRLPGVLHELAVLRYHRYAYGFHSLYKDLVR
ncbi:MAG: glycosyl transferase [Nitrosomonadales bacterium SCN 54-20]|nr:MAG: glycosyl transferase [Nitrosomonadales bacterium SCN 54-20]